MNKNNFIKITFLFCAVLKHANLSAVPITTLKNNSTNTMAITYVSPDEKCTNIVHPSHLLIIEGLIGTITITVGGYTYTIQEPQKPCHLALYWANNKLTYTFKPTGNETVE